MQVGASTCVQQDRLSTYAKQDKLQWHVQGAGMGPGWRAQAGSRCSHAAGRLRRICTARLGLRPGGRQSALVPELHNRGAEP